MTKQNATLHSFNHGVIDSDALARIDADRLKFAAETQTNWMPRVFGKMIFRPGTEYIGPALSTSALHAGFIYSNSDTAILEFTDYAMRVRVSEQIITRVAVSSAVTNGNFTSDISGWTTADEGGATSSWDSHGYLSLLGTGYNSAITYQKITVSGADQNKEHALAIRVIRGYVTLRVGTSAGSEEYVSATTLRAGYHSLALTPAGDFYVQLEAVTSYASLVDSVQIESAGAMTVTTPWPVASIGALRFKQSIDVLFVACIGYKQRRIERYSTRSWSVVEYDNEDGPFRVENVTSVTLAASAVKGEVTLTASKPTFRSTHVGALFRIESIGQEVTATLSGDDQWTNSVKVFGTGDNRKRTLTVSGTWSGSLRYQRSSDNATWFNGTQTYTSNGTNTENDGLDNQIVYYRVGFKSGDYTSGSAVVDLSVPNGFIDGIVKITAVTNSTTATAIVLSDLGGTDASSTWWEGEWSDYRGWPTSCELHDGRLWWAGQDKLWASVSDAFSSFDDTVEGDSGPLSRSIGSGPVSTVSWMISSQRLLMGCDGAEFSARSSSLDEPMTPTDFNIREASNLGSTNLQAIKVDSTAIFVTKGSQVYQMTYGANYGGYPDYAPKSLCLLNQRLLKQGVVSMAVQRHPDTRVHCVMADGTVSILVFDQAENVEAWVPYQTNGLVKQALVMPGTNEDKVYYTVLRNGVLNLERWALEDECEGGTLNKNIDCHVIHSGAAVNAISGLPFPDGTSVVAWADGKDIGTFTVESGAISLPASYSNIVAGLSYTGQYKSSKLAYASNAPLNQRKRVDHLGFILAYTHAQGLKYGSDFDNLDSLPLVEAGADVDPDSIWTAYDFDATEFDDTWTTDSRICLQAQSPRPATVMAMTLSIETNDKS